MPFIILSISLFGVINAVSAKFTKIISPRGAILVGYACCGFGRRGDAIRRACICSSSSAGTTLYSPFSSSSIHSPYWLVCQWKTSSPWLYTITSAPSACITKRPSLRAGTAHAESAATQHIIEISIFFMYISYFFTPCFSSHCVSLAVRSPSLCAFLQLNTAFPFLHCLA